MQKGYRSLMSSRFSHQPFNLWRAFYLIYRYLSLWSKNFIQSKLDLDLQQSKYINQTIYQRSHMLGGRKKLRLSYCGKTLGESLFSVVTRNYLTYWCQCLNTGCIYKQPVCLPLGLLCSLVQIVILGLEASFRCKHYFSANFNFIYLNKSLWFKLLFQ